MAWIRQRRCPCISKMIIMVLDLLLLVFIYSKPSREEVFEGGRKWDARRQRGKEGGKGMG